VIQFVIRNVEYRLGGRKRLLAQPIWQAVIGRCETGSLVESAFQPDRLLSDVLQDILVNRATETGRQQLAQDGLQRSETKPGEYAGA
jgi:hypothetical protein